MFCTKLYIKLPVSLCHNFLFLLTFERLMPWSYNLAHFFLSFLQYLVSDFWYLISFKSYSPFCTEKWAKIDMRACFQHNFISKANLKKSRAKFFRSQILLAGETKRMSLARPVFNLKAMEFGAFFAYFHLFRHLKVIQLRAVAQENSHLGDFFESCVFCIIERIMVSASCTWNFRVIRDRFVV